MKNLKSLVIGAGIVLFGAGCGPSSVPPVSVPRPATSAPEVSQPKTETAVPEAKNRSIEISSFAFNPASLTVKVGTTVTWTNQDSAPHTVVADDGSFASQKFSKGESFNFIFTKPGTFQYFCSVHPSMRATVIVE
jgi:plastocyanin